MNDSRRVNVREKIIAEKRENFRDSFLSPRSTTMARHILVENSHTYFIDNTTRRSYGSFFIVVVTASNPQISFKRELLMLVLVRL